MGGGGGKKRGEENLTNDTPPKKGVRLDPPCTVRFPPPSGVVASGSLNGPDPCPEFPFL